MHNFLCSASKLLPISWGEKITLVTLFQVFLAWSSKYGPSSLLFKRKKCYYLNFIFLPLGNIFCGIAQIHLKWLIICDIVCPSIYIIRQAVRGVFTSPTEAAHELAVRCAFFVLAFCVHLYPERRVGREASHEPGTFRTRFFGELSVRLQR